MTPRARCAVTAAAAACALLIVAARAAPALILDLTREDVERALTIARATAGERERFHAPYIKTIDTAAVERVEVVSEYRRVVLLAEEHAVRGDRQFAYSTTRALQALAVWKGRVSIVARLRFHPQNTYIDVPEVTMIMEGHPGALVGVLRAPVHVAPAAPGDRLPVLGAVVEGVFEAQAAGQAIREFVVALEGRELARVQFDFATLD